MIRFSHKTSPKTKKYQQHPQTAKTKKAAVEDISTTAFLFLFVQTTQL